MVMFFLILALVFVVLLVIITNIVIVPQSKVYVVERLGSYSDTWSAGLHIKIPFIERIAKKVILKEQVDYQPGQVVSKTLAQNDAVSVTLFAFAAGEEIGTHDSTGDAMVTVLEGVGQFTIDGVPYLVKPGEALVMPAKKPHSVYAPENFKWLLTVIFPHNN